MWTDLASIQKTSVPVRVQFVDPDNSCTSYAGEKAKFEDFTPPAVLVLGGADTPADLKAPLKLLMSEKPPAHHSAV